MPGRCAFGSPFWYLLATDNPAKAANTSMVCQMGAIGPRVLSADTVSVIDDIALFLSGRSQQARTGRPARWPDRAL